MLAQVVRSGLIEAVHDGAIAVADPEGVITHTFGDADRVFFLRSAAKPFQAEVTLALGGPLTPEEIAIICASHGGDPVQIAYVEKILDEAGLSESDLATPPAWPESNRAAARLTARGHTRPRPLWHNCSGKHAGMLRACVAQGWPTSGYTDPGHPIQLAIVEAMRRLMGEGVTPVGVDGCGAPVFRGSARGLSSAFAALHTTDAYAPIVDAMSRFPALTSAPGHADQALATWLGGVGKRGAEGCLALALPGRGSVAVKVWDGSSRSLGAVMFSVLDQLGWIPHGSSRNLESSLVSPVLGGGRAVGTVEPLAVLERV